MEWKSCSTRDPVVDAQLSHREAHIVQILSDEVEICSSDQSYLLLLFLYPVHFFRFVVQVHCMADHEQFEKLLIL